MSDLVVKEMYRDLGAFAMEQLLGGDCGTTPFGHDVLIAVFGAFIAANQGDGPDDDLVAKLGALFDGRHITQIMASVLSALIPAVTEVEEAP